MVMTPRDVNRKKLRKIQRVNEINKQKAKMICAMQKVIADAGGRLGADEILHMSVGDFLEMMIPNNIYLSLYITDVINPHEVTAFERPPTVPKVDHRTHKVVEKL